MSQIAKRVGREFFNPIGMYQEIVYGYKGRKEDRIKKQKKPSLEESLSYDSTKIAIDARF